MPPSCGSIALLVNIVLWCHPSSATIAAQMELLSKATDVQISPNDTWSCCGESGNCTHPSLPSCAFDDNSSTRWKLPSSQRKATISVGLTPGYIIDHFEVSFDSSSVIPSSIAMTLVGNDVTWTTYNNKSCQASDRNLRRDGSLYYSCSQAGEIWNVSVPDGLFSAGKGSNDWIWWRAFSRLQLTMEANDVDYINQTQNSSIVIADIRLYGWTQPAAVCNCHPVGVVSTDRPCDSNGTCICRGGTTPDQCIPVIFDGPRTVTRGPISGGTKLRLSVGAAQEIYLQNISRIKVGNDYEATLSKINSTLIVIQTIAANLSDAGAALPIWICWERTTGIESCLITTGDFTYASDPVVRSISPTVSIEGGGITLTATGENLDFATSPHVVIVVYKVFSMETDNVYSYSNRPYPPDHTDDRMCTIVNSTTLTCRTMPLAYDVTLSRNIQMIVGISFNNLSYNSYSSCVNCFPFTLTADPSVYDWNNGPPKPFRIYNGDKSVDIPGNGYQVGFDNREYRVEVSGITSEIIDVVNNVITFYPPDVSLLADYTKKQSIILYIGAYHSVTVGDLIYYKNWIDEPPHRDALIGGLVGGVGGLILVIVVILLIVRYCRKRKEKDELINYEPRYTRAPGENDGPLTGYLAGDVKAQVDKYTVPYDRIQLIKELGKGNFGKVYQGTLIDRTGTKQPVAIKSLHGRHEIKDRVEFVEEAVLMADFCHKHVLSLIAIVIHENVPFVVLPLMELGDLRTYISKDKNSFTVGQLVNFSLQVAEGMEYLASRRFVHRDLAARNCMINNDLLVKVADFGLARDIFEKDYYRAQDHQRPLPVKWMAIECLSSNTEFTEKSDVWSYGVLVWELMTRGKRPYSDIDNLDLRRFLLQGRRLEKPPVAPDFVYNIMLRCWLPERNDRPRFKDIVKELKEILSAAEASGDPSRKSSSSNEAMDVTVGDEERASYLQLSVNPQQ